MRRARRLDRPGPLLSESSHDQYQRENARRSGHGPAAGGVRATWPCFLADRSKVQFSRRRTLLPHARFGVPGYGRGCSVGVQRIECRTVGGDESRLVDEVTEQIPLGDEGQWVIALASGGCGELLAEAIHHG